MFRSDALRRAGRRRRGLGAALCASWTLGVCAAGAEPLAEMHGRRDGGVAAEPSAAPDRAAEPIVLQRLDGSAQELAPREGETLLLHFWASWCASCIEEFAVVEEAARQCPVQRLRLYAVNVGDEADGVLRFAAEHVRSVPVLRDPDARVWRRFGGYGLPTNVYWSREASRSEEVENVTMSLGFPLTMEPSPPNGPSVP